MQQMINRFMEYVKYDTQSDPKSSTSPSTNKQYKLLDLLNSQLLDLELEVHYDTTFGFLYGKLPANTQRENKIGFIAHVDTAPDFSGENVNPQIVSDYQGQVITLNEDCKLDPEIFPSLNNYLNQTIITTDGNSLLGADDKAGITEIMEAVTYFVENPEVLHGDILVGFTTDEEIGRGADNFNTMQFGADFAYTVDGGAIGELQYENFNAAGVEIEIEGVSVHPGSAKDTMINSGELAVKFHNSLPELDKPELTEDYQGFIMLNHLNTTISKGEMSYIIRDHNFEKFMERKKLMEDNFKTIVKTVSPNSTIKIIDQYYNMDTKIKPVFEIIELAEQSMKNVGVTPTIVPIRGGTDGSKLSFMGLPTPNLFTGGHNFHGQYEYVVVESMLKAKETIIEIIKLSK